MVEAGKICKNIPMVDCHLDLGMYVASERRKGRTHVIKEDYLDDMRAGGFNVVVAACFLSEEEVATAAAETARKQIAALRMEEQECPDDIAICTTYDDIVNAVDAGKLAVIISFEGVEPIEGKPELLDEFYELGVRGLGVSWSRKNFAAEGAPYTATDAPANGLTDIGKEVIRKAAEMGYFIDVTHLNDPGVDDVIALGAKPVIASHSNCRAINPTPRNIDDEHLLAIARTGGVICINQVSGLVADNEEEITIKTMADHMDYAKKLVGIDHLGIGFDFCDLLYKDEPDTTVVINGNEVGAYDLLKNHRGIAKFREELERRNYSPAEIQAIFGSNMMRIFEGMLK